MPPLRTLLRAAAILIPLGVAAHIAFSLATADRALLASLADVPLASLALVIGFSAVPWFTQSLRMVIWTRFVGEPLTFGEALRIYAGGVLGSAVTPSAVGGGSIRWALALRRGVPAGKAAALFSVEGIEDVVFFAAALPAAVLLSAADESRAVREVTAELRDGLDSPLIYVLAASVLLALAAWAALRLVLGDHLGPRARRRALRLAARIRRPFQRGWRDIRQTAALVARGGKSIFLLTLPLTAIQWAARYSVATVIIVALGGKLQPFLYWVLGWMTYALSSAAPTPGAAGAAEVTFALLHAPFVPATILGLTASIWRLALFYLPATVAALVYPLFVARDDAPEAGGAAASGARGATGARGGRGRSPSRRRRQTLGGRPFASGSRA